MEKSLNRTALEMKKTVDAVFEGLKEGPPRPSGNHMIPNNKEYPEIVQVLTSDGMDSVFRAIWVAKICRLDSLVARTAAMLLAIKIYGGGAIIYQETLEHYTGANSNEQVAAIKELQAANLNPEVKLGLQTALHLMRDYCHLNSTRGDDHGYVCDEELDENSKFKILALRVSQYVFSDQLPYYC